ncbi:MAG: hypothetical protein ACE5PM_09545 [Candidatus Hydrothermarchaeales archaeon]
MRGTAVVLLALVVLSVLAVGTVAATSNQPNKAPNKSSVTGGNSANNGGCPMVPMPNCPHHQMQRKPVKHNPGK